MRSTFQALKNRFVAQGDDQDSKEDRDRLKIKIVHPHLDEEATSTTQENSVPATSKTRMPNAFSKWSKGLAWSKRSRKASYHEVESEDTPTLDEGKKETEKEETKNSINKIGGILRRSMYGLRFSGFSEMDAHECAEEETKRQNRPRSLLVVGSNMLSQFRRRCSKPSEEDLAAVTIESSSLPLLDASDTPSSSGSVEVSSGGNISTPKTSVEDSDEKNIASSMSIASEVNGTNDVSEEKTTKPHEINMDDLPAPMQRLDNKAAYDKIALRPKRKKAARRTKGQPQHIHHSNVNVNGFDDLSPTVDDDESEDEAVLGGVFPPVAKRSRPPSETQPAVDDESKREDSSTKSTNKRYSYLGRSPLGPGPAMVPSLQDVKMIRLRRTQTGDGAKSSPKLEESSRSTSRSFNSQSTPVVTTQKKSKSDLFSGNFFRKSKPTKSSKPNTKDANEKSATSPLSPLTTTDINNKLKEMHGQDAHRDKPSSNKKMEREKGKESKFAATFKLFSSTENEQKRGRGREKADPEKKSGRNYSENNSKTSDLDLDTTGAKKDGQNEEKMQCKKEESQERKSPELVVNKTMETDLKEEGEMESIKIEKESKHDSRSEEIEEVEMNEETRGKSGNLNEQKSPNVKKETESFSFPKPNLKPVPKARAKNTYKDTVKSVKDDKKDIDENEKNKEDFPVRRLLLSSGADDKPSPKKPGSGSKIVENVNGAEEDHVSAINTVSAVSGFKDADLSFPETKPRTTSETMVSEDYSLSVKSACSPLLGNNKGPETPLSPTGNKSPSWQSHTVEENKISSKAEILIVEDTPSVAATTSPASPKDKEDIKKESKSDDPPFNLAASNVLVPAKIPELKKDEEQTIGEMYSRFKLKPIGDRAGNFDTRRNQSMKVTPSSSISPSRPRSFHARNTALSPIDVKKTISGSDDKKSVSEKKFRSESEPAVQKPPVSPDKKPVIRYGEVRKPVVKPDSAIGVSAEKTPTPTDKKPAIRIEDGIPESDVKIQSKSKDKKVLQQIPPITPEKKTAIRKEATKILAQDAENNNFEQAKTFVTENVASPKKNDVTTVQPRPRARTTPPEGLKVKIRDSAKLEDKNGGSAPSWVQLARRRSKVWEDTGLKNLKASPNYSSPTKSLEKDRSERPKSLFIPPKSASMGVKSRENTPQSAVDQTPKPITPKAQLTPVSSAKRVAPLTSSSNVTPNRINALPKTNVPSPKRVGLPSTKEPPVTGPSWLAIAMQKQKRWTKEETA